MNGLNLRVALVSFLFIPPLGALADEPVDYPRQIRPILSNYCLDCHGPDDATRKSGLRLDNNSALTQPGESGALAIVAGEPEESELIARVMSDDPDYAMPPAESKKKLSDEQKGTLRRWIAAGAPYSEHWSFIPPRRSAPPAVKNTSWVKNDIDRYVLAELEEQGLSPSPPADRLTLARRASLDLIGLPPSPEEAQALAADERPDAFERYVDKLLASPRYGERWARLWLDAARYADSNGYEKDRPRSVWPYRDWVIRALNDDMPFDRFTIEQVAGDLLPDATLEQRIATGFHRNTMTNEEGGIDVAEFRFYAMVDRVVTTGAAWLGLTVTCARCHSHKYDPVMQREFYKLMALMNNTDEVDVEIPQPEVTRRREELEGQIAALVAKRAERLAASSELLAKAEAWEADARRAATHWTMVSPARAVSRLEATMTTLPDRSVLVSGDKPNQDTYEVDLDVDLPVVTAVRLEALPHESLPLGGPGRAPVYSEGDFLLGEFSLAAAARGVEQAPTVVAVRDATHSFAQEGRSAALAVDGDLDTGWSIQGRVGEAHWCVFPLEKPLENPGGTRLRIVLEQRYIHQMTLGRFRLSVAGEPGPIRASAVPPETEAALVKPPGERSADEARLVREHFLSTAAEFAEETKQIAELRRNMPRYPTSLALAERPAEHFRPTRRAHRGEYLLQQETVEGGVPAALHPLPADAPRNRLGLARWLVDERNPLVGRVVMNRHWQALFGRGLVRTTEDFGLQGELPSHPELLDYLACQWRSGSWSTKAMHRLIATSATYQQSSRVSPELLTRDPNNVFLARGSRVRLDAELIRDSALFASGLLSGKIGGPSVFPPQPAGAADLSHDEQSWTVSSGEDRYRRGLYTFIKRTSPYATFVTFDAPSGEACVVRRDRTNTPLQALTLLNDTVFVEAAQGLARRVVREGGSTAADRARRLIRLCLVREGAEEEVADLVAFHDQQLVRLKAKELDAAAIAGSAPPPEEAAELAAWTLAGRVVMNLDEFITKE